MITVGQPLHYYALDAYDQSHMVRRDAQPFLALVTFAHRSDSANMLIWDHDGNQHKRIGVPVWFGGDRPAGSFATFPASVDFGEPSLGPMSDPELIANHLQPTGVVLTEGDAEADLKGEPRPDNPGRSSFEPAVEAAQPAAKSAPKRAAGARKSTS